MSSYIVVHQNPSDSVLSTCVSSKPRKRVADACFDLVDYATGLVATDELRGRLVVRSDEGEEMCAVEPINSQWRVISMSTSLSKAAVKHLSVIGYPEPGTVMLEKSVAP